MKKRFYEGEEVVCVDKKMSPYRETSCVAPSLPYNSLQIIKSYYAFYGGRWWVEIVGTQEGSLYSEDCFAPITQIRELMDEVNSEYIELQFLRTILSEF
jgi:hypothetical protein